MYQEFFLQKGVLILPIVAMMSFVGAFLAISWWSLRAAPQQQYAALSQLPLDGEVAHSQVVGDGQEVLR
jgi:hypothetical protein